MGRIVGLQFQELPKFVCPDCGERFQKKADLAKHQKAAHSATEPPQTSENKPNEAEE